MADKYPDIEFRTPDWLIATELARRYIVGTPVTIRDALIANKDLEYVQRKRNGKITAVCLHRDYIADFCKISGLRPAEELDTKTKDWLPAYKLSALYISGGPTKILSAMNQYQKDMPGYIKKVRSGKNIVLCLHYDAVDVFCDLSGMKRKKVTNVGKSPIKKEKEPETRKYQVPDVLMSMPPLLCSLFGREESR